MIIRHHLLLMAIKNANAKLLEIVDKEKLDQTDIKNIGLLCGVIRQAGDELRMSVDREFMIDTMNNNFKKYL